MRMEVLAVKTQYSSMLSSNKVKDWTSTLTPPPPPPSSMPANNNTNSDANAVVMAKSNNAKHSSSSSSSSKEQFAANGGSVSGSNAANNLPYPQNKTTNKIKNSINKKSARNAVVNAEISGGVVGVGAGGNNGSKTRATAAATVTAAATQSPRYHTQNFSNNTSSSSNSSSNNNNNINNIFYCDDIDASAVNELSLRLLDELRAAKSRHLTCTEVSLPCDLTTRIAAEIIRVSEKEPCGIRGCTIYIEFEDEPNNSRRIASLKLDAETVSTFEVYLTLRQDHRGWTALLPQFMKSLARTITISPDFSITKHKLYATQQNSYFSSSNSNSSTSGTRRSSSNRIVSAAISTPTS